MGNRCNVGNGLNGSHFIICVHDGYERRVRSNRTANRFRIGLSEAVDGQLRYRWPVSTGATGFSTPVGSYTPFRMEVMHYSQEWDNAGMPHAIFFTTRGHSIHGSDHPGLGTPVSHGCVRLTLSNATTLYQLVQANGMSQTKVVVRGPDPLGVTVPSQPPRQRARVWRPFQFFQF